MNPKRLLIVNDPFHGHISHKIRGTSMITPLESMGWKVSELTFRPYDLGGLVDFAISYDVVYLIKVDSLELIKALKEYKHIKVVFDLTDALWMPHFRKDGWGNINSILSTSDAIFCCNNYDKQYALLHNPNVFVIPPYANVTRFDEIKQRIAPKNNNDIVIGWLGSTGTSYSVMNIRNPLEKLSRKFPNLFLYLVGADQSGMSSVMRTNMFSGNYNEDMMIQEIFKMDIGVFPITRSEEDYKIRGPLKTFNYMAAGIPTVSYDAGDCSTIIKDGVNGMLAKTNEEWENKLELLIKNENLRKEIGLNGYKTIKENFSREKISEILNSSLEKVKDLNQKHIPIFLNSKNIIRSDVINYYLSLKKEPTYYLEIGAKLGENIARVKSTYKDGVDVDVNSKCSFIMPSDEFFKQNTKKYDVIFIDGSHIFEQVYRDVINSLKCLKENGIIVMHDCNPTEERYQTDIPTDGPWNGTVWKAYAKLRMERNDLGMFVIDTDWGLGVIDPSKKQTKLTHSQEIFNYKFFSTIRKEVLNLITVEEWINKLGE